MFCLPDEVLYRIFSKLDAVALSKSSSVCLDFNRISNDQYLWRDIAKQRFPFCNVDKGNSWKKCYVNLLKLKR